MARLGQNPQRPGFARTRRECRGSFRVAFAAPESHHLDMERRNRHSSVAAAAVLSLLLATSGLGCKDESPLGADFGVEMLEPLTVTWDGDDPQYHASSGALLNIRARASSRVDWRVEITSDTGGKVIQDDKILQESLAFTARLLFTVEPQSSHIFSVGDVVTVRAIATPQIKPSQAHRATFQFTILP